MANSHRSDPPPQRFRRGTPASELLREASFPLAVRGYDRRAVDEFVEEMVDFGIGYSEIARDDHRLFVDAFRNGQIPSLADR